MNILVLRFGALGDVLHAIPAVTSLKQSFPAARIAWAARSKWFPVLAGNPSIDELIPYDRNWATVKRLRRFRPDWAFDFQGLIQSAIAGRLASPRHFFGFAPNTAREPLASLFYTERTSPPGPHRIERNLQLAAASGAHQLTDETWLPVGSREASLPATEFVLASPFAGWASKQWPLEHYRELSRLLERQGLPLVLNVAPHQAAGLAGFHVHCSSLDGLIDATCRAAAVVGVDSGPLHLAAALRKPGVAIFGPTDPQANGPYGGTIEVLRKPGFGTTYKRETEIHPSMRAVTPDEVFDHLRMAVAQ